MQQKTPNSNLQSTQSGTNVTVLSERAERSRFDTRQKLRPLSSSFQSEQSCSRKDIFNMTIKQKGWYAMTCSTPRSINVQIWPKFVHPTWDRCTVSQQVEIRATIFASQHEDKLECSPCKPYESYDGRRYQAAVFF